MRNSKFRIEFKKYRINVRDLYLMNVALTLRFRGSYFKISARILAHGFPHFFQRIFGGHYLQITPSRFFPIRYLVTTLSLDKTKSAIQNCRQINRK